MNRLQSLIVLFAVTLAAGASLADALFAPAVPYGAGGEPWAVCSADFDGDGNSDLAVVNHSSGDISVLANFGDGTFAPAVNYAVGVLPTFITALDIDGDLNYDLAASNAASDDVSILMNYGDGTFAPALSYAAHDAPSSICWADFDNDGDNDLAVTNYQSNDVSILMNNGDGSLAGPVDYSAGTGPISVYTEDYDLDGFHDLAIANETSDSMHILINNNDGTFGTGVNYWVGDCPTSIYSSDLDNDSDADLAVVYGQDIGGLGFIKLYWNSGDGLFESGSGDLIAGGDLHSVSGADFDRDGDIDIVASYNQDAAVVVYYNNGDGSFSHIGEDSEYSVGSTPLGLCAADLDSDGDYDLAVANGGSDNVSILINLTSCCRLRGDFNHDGSVDPLDIIDPTQQKPSYIFWYWLGGEGPVCEEEADANGDGHIDPIDVIYMVNYLWKYGPPPVPCQ